MHKHIQRHKGTHTCIHILYTHWDILIYMHKQNRSSVICVIFGGWLSKVSGFIFKNAVQLFIFICIYNIQLLCLALMLMQLIVKWLTLDCAQFRWMTVHIRRECNEKNIYNIKTWIWMLYVSIFVYVLLRIFFLFFKAESFLIYSSPLWRFLKIEFVFTSSSSHSLSFMLFHHLLVYSFFNPFHFILSTKM